jgi:hypothetical protein
MVVEGWIGARLVCDDLVGVIPLGEFLCWGAFTTPNGQQSDQIGGHGEYIKIAE